LESTYFSSEITHQELLDLLQKSSESLLTRVRFKEGKARAALPMENLTAHGLLASRIVGEKLLKLGERLQQRQVDELF